MQSVVVIETKDGGEATTTTTPYTMVFASSRGLEKETIKWLFKTIQHNLSDYGIDIMPLLKQAKDYPSALKILREHAGVIDVDGKY